MAKFVSRSSGETKRIAATLLRRWRTTRRPLVLALTGELGSGKTTFAQGLARSLGVRSRVQSPTFVLMKWYPLGQGRRPFHHFIHIDAYRLDALAETRHLGLRGTFRDRDAIIAIEWAERIKKLIPRNAVWVRFGHKPKNQRIIEVRMTNGE